jgi:GNAT superfamily N-acetyltransferase
LPLTNFERMIQLAEDVFDAKHDPEQLDVNDEVIKRFQQIHPATVSEYDEGDGPIAWVLLLPTTIELMNQFLDHSISEKELFYRTPLNIPYEAIYLCSGMVLEEYRRQGIAKRLAIAAIEKMRKDHPIQYLFTWPFTREGDMAAAALAKATGLPLYERSNSK